MIGLRSAAGNPNNSPEVKAVDVPLELVPLRAYRRIGVSAFAKRRQLSRDLLVITAVSKSGLASPDPDTPIRRSAHTPIRRHASPADGPF